MTNQLSQAEISRLNELLHDLETETYKRIEYRWGFSIDAVGRLVRVLKVIKPDLVVRKANRGMMTVKISEWEEFKAWKVKTQT